MGTPSNTTIAGELEAIEQMIAGRRYGEALQRLHASIQHLWMNTRVNQYVSNHDLYGAWWEQLKQLTDQMEPVKLVVERDHSDLVTTMRRWEAQRLVDLGLVFYCNLECPKQYEHAVVHPTMHGQEQSGVYSSALIDWLREQARRIDEVSDGT